MAQSRPAMFPKKNILTDNDVDTSAVTATTKDCFITSIRLATTGAANFSLEDIATVPNKWYEAVVIGANSVLNEQLQDDPLFCEGGFKYDASAADMDMQIVFWTRP